MKGFRDRAHRSVGPEATLARVKPLLAAAGITRVAMLTGLDTIGIPVAAAYRPNSRSIAVHQGKGSSTNAAKISAVMEAIETYHAETCDLSLRLASFETIRRTGAALDPASLPRTGSDLPGDARLLWTQAVRLADGSPVWVPYELVGIDLGAGGIAGFGMFQATTNGLASGNHMQEAVAHALYEVIERDAVALWQVMTAAAQDARVLNLATIDDPSATDWLQKIAAAGLVAQVWDVTSNVGLATFVCLIVGGLTGLDDIQPELGFGCHADRGVALSRAIGEAAQARLTVISGARDDLSASGYEDAEIRELQQIGRAWLLESGERHFHDAPTLAHDTLGGDLRATMAALERSGFSEAVMVDLTRREFGVPVVRVVVPGLEGPWTPPGGEYSPGARAREMAKARFAP